MTPEEKWKRLELFREAGQSVVSSFAAAKEVRSKREAQQQELQLRRDELEDRRMEKQEKLRAEQEKEKLRISEQSRIADEFSQQNWNRFDQMTAAQRQVAASAVKKLDSPVLEIFKQGQQEAAMLNRDFLTREASQATESLDKRLERASMEMENAKTPEERAKWGEELKKAGAAYAQMQAIKKSVDAKTKKMFSTDDPEEYKPAITLARILAGIPIEKSELDAYVEWNTKSLQDLSGNLISDTVRNNQIQSLKNRFRIRFIGEENPAQQPGLSANPANQTAEEIAASITQKMRDQGFKPKPKP